MLYANSDQAVSIKSRKEFPNPDDPLGKTGIWKLPYIDRHLPGHKGYDHSVPPGIEVRTDPGPAGTEDFPIAYLVRQDPHTCIQTHFHKVNQFQVFVGGGGMFGKEPIRPGMVHYAGAWSAYGPIRSGSEGVDYFTLRNAWDIGAGWMPESRDVLREQARTPRNMVYPTRHFEAQGAPDHGVAITRTLGFAMDGLGAWSVRVEPGSTYGGPDPTVGAGQFWIVLEGGLRHADASTLGPMGVIWVGPHERSLRIEATDLGVDLLIVQFPAAPRSGAPF